MNAIEISQPGGPEVLRPVVRTRPQPGADEVLIRVYAAGINRPDIFQRKGHYPPPPGVSDLPGLEVAGVIEGGDIEGNDLQVGDAVCALIAGGGYAEYAVAPVGQVLPVPRGLSFAQAAGLPETFFTVWSNVFDRAGLRPGETLLVQGGSGGIGVAAIQIAAARGHTVFATAGSDEKCRLCESLGAVRGINYRNEDFSAVVLELTQGRGVDVILDVVGGDYLSRELACLAEDGCLALIAVQGGTQAQMDLGLLLRRRLTVTGSTLRARNKSFKSAIAQRLYEEVWPLLETGRIKPMLHKTFAMQQAAQAHALMESGAHSGKIVLVMDERAADIPLH